MGAWKNEWAQRCNKGMASQFTTMFGVYVHGYENVTKS